MNQRGNPAIPLSVSLPLLTREVCEKYGISPTKALKSGIVLLATMQDRGFPENEYEQMLYDESYVPKMKLKIVERITGAMGGKNDKD